MNNIRSVIYGLLILITGPLWLLYGLALIVAIVQANAANAIVSAVIVAITFVILRWACYRLVNMKLRVYVDVEP